MRSSHLAILGALIASLAGCDSGDRSATTGPSVDVSSNTVASAARTGQPLSGLTSPELGQFQAGASVFNRVFTPQAGLGPLFNAASWTRWADKSFRTTRRRS